MTLLDASTPQSLIIYVREILDVPTRLAAWQAANPQLLPTVDAVASGSVRSSSVSVPTALELVEYATLTLNSACLEHLRADGRQSVASAASAALGSCFEKTKVVEINPVGGRTSRLLALDETAFVARCARINSKSYQILEVVAHARSLSTEALRSGACSALIARLRFSDVSDIDGCHALAVLVDDVLTGRLGSFPVDDLTRPQLPWRATAELQAMALARTTPVSAAEISFFAKSGSLVFCTPERGLSDEAVAMLKSIQIHAQQRLTADALLVRLGHMSIQEIQDCVGFHQRSAGQIVAAAAEFSTELLVAALDAFKCQLSALGNSQASFRPMTSIVLASKFLPEDLVPGVLELIGPHQLNAALDHLSPARLVSVIEWLANHHSDAKAVVIATHNRPSSALDKMLAVLVARVPGVVSDVMASSNRSCPPARALSAFFARAFGPDVDAWQMAFSLGATWAGSGEDMVVAVRELIR